MASIERTADGLRPGALVIADAGTDDARLTASLAALFGPALPPAAAAYVKRALAVQREGQGAHAQMCLALAGLPAVTDPLEAAWRVSAAHGLMKAGVAPATIAAALTGKATPLRREYDPNQPRVAAGNGEQSGRWAKEGESKGAGNGQASRKPQDWPSPAPPAGKPKKGVQVKLPDGTLLLDDRGEPMMSPVADLTPVAEAGRKIGERYRTLLEDPNASGGALIYLGASLKEYVAQRGIFDYQRERISFFSYRYIDDYRAVSNFNVGLFCQQAGLTLNETLSIAGGYAHWFSSNAAPDRPYGLDQHNYGNTALGWETGASGVFDPATDGRAHKAGGLGAIR